MNRIILTRRHYKQGIIHSTQRRQVGQCYLLTSTISPSLSTVFGNTKWPFTRTIFPSNPILLAASAAVLPDLILIIWPSGHLMITTSPRTIDFARFNTPETASWCTCSSHWSIVLNKLTCRICIALKKFLITKITSQIVLYQRRNYQPCYWCHYQRKGHGENWFLFPRKC